jgi:hypothetical protein
MHEASTKNAETIAAEVRKGLATLVRLGSATSSDFVFETPEVLHALRQLGVASAGEPLELEVEKALTRAIDELPLADAEAARIMFGVDPTFRSIRVGERREHAAETLGVAPGTFRNRHEDRLLDSLSRKVALFLLSAPLSFKEEVPNRNRSRVLLIHGHDSIGVNEVARLVESLGLEPILWQEALDRTGLMSPSVIERFRSCLDIAQGVIVVLEGGLGESALNLVFEAGLALGLAEERTVVVQLGDQTPPNDLAAVNILRLRSTGESINALSAALENAGCAVGEVASSPKEDQKGIDAGWFDWTPAKAESSVYTDIAEAVNSFQAVPMEAGEAAAVWLKEGALKEFPETKTYLLLGEGRVEGFIALRSSWLSVEFEHEQPERLEFDSDASIPALTVCWMARHRDAPGIGEKLLLFAASLAYEAGEEAGAAALTLVPYGEEEASVLMHKFPFLHRLKNSSYLWMPMTIPQSAPKTENNL